MEPHSYKNLGILGDGSRTPLSWAAGRGNDAVVALLLARDDVDADSKDKDGRTPLSWAAERGNDAVVKLLLARDDVDVDSKDKDGRMPLSWAAEKGNWAVVKLLLTKTDIDPNTEVVYGQSLLSWAIENGNWAVVELLLTKNDIDPNTEVVDGRSLLSWAAEKGNWTVVELLLIKNDIDPNTEVVDGRSLLLWAAEKGNWTVVELLLIKNDIDPNTEVVDGRSLLSWAAEKGNWAVVELLLTKNDIDPNTEVVDGRSLLSWAAEKGNWAVVELLLTKNDIDPNTEVVDGRSLLSWAAEKGNWTIVKLLLARDDVDVESKDKDNGTPLSWAAFSGHKDVVKLLLKEGAVVDSKESKFGRTSLSWAAGNGHDGVVRLLLTKGADPNAIDKNSRTPLLWAIHKHQEAVVRLLLTEADINPDRKDKDNRTPLSLAAERGNHVVVKLLLARDDVGTNSKDKDGRTPLSWAAEKGNWTVVELLLARDDVDPNTEVVDGRSLLSWAVEKGNWTIVKLLVARSDVDADSKDKDGRTPLSWAAEHGNDAVVKLLLARDDVGTNSKDKDGRTPLSWAAEKGNWTVVKLLVARSDVDVTAADENATAKNSIAYSPKETAGFVRLHPVKVTDPSELHDPADSFERDQQSHRWREHITSHLSEIIRDNLEYCEAFGTGPLWTCRPPKDTPTEEIPLTIGGYPVVIPVEYHYPASAFTVPPPDPYSHIIDPSVPIDEAVIKTIFETFGDILGFYLLINGMLQLIVPDDFDIQHALSHRPVAFGGTRVSYIHEDMIPTAERQEGKSLSSTEEDLIVKLPQTERQSHMDQPIGSSSNQLHSTSNSGTSPLHSLGRIAGTSDLKVGSLVQARVEGSKETDIFQGKIGLLTEAEGQHYLVVSSHVLTQALTKANSRQFPGENWIRNVSLIASNGGQELGQVTETFDPDARTFPHGFQHDVSLVDVGSLPKDLIASVASPMPTEWLSQEGWNAIKLASRDLFLLDNPNIPARSIGLAPSQCQMVGQAIFDHQPRPKGKAWIQRLFKKEVSVPSPRTWTGVISRSVLYRIDAAMIAPGAESGTAVCIRGEAADNKQFAKVAGFSSWVQPAYRDTKFGVENQSLHSRLQKGCVAFYGAFQAPDKLIKDHRIV